MEIFEGFLESTWLGPAAWAALYISDYFLTVACARMYRAQSTIAFEGSYEITPLFQADVNALRKISPRFVLALVASTAYLWFVRQIADPFTEISHVYDGVLGAMLLTQATVHIRHLRNWFLFARGATVIQGRLMYPRVLLLQMSALELLLFAGLYFGLYLVTANTFIFGGTLACGILALNHYRLARRHRASLLTSVS
jgi:hypothetical protein